MGDWQRDLLKLLCLLDCICLEGHEFGNVSMTVSERVRISLVGGLLIVVVMAMVKQLTVSTTGWAVAVVVAQVGHHRAVHHTEQQVTAVTQWHPAVVTRNPSECLFVAFRHGQATRACATACSTSTKSTAKWCPFTSVGMETTDRRLSTLKSQSGSLLFAVVKTWLDWYFQCHTRLLCYIEYCIHLWYWLMQVFVRNCCVQKLPLLLKVQCITSEV